MAKIKRGPWPLWPILITAFWLFTVGSLIYRHYAPAAFRPSEERIVADDEYWMGIYVGGEKIGYTMARIRSLADGYEARESAFMKVKVMGAEKTIKISTDAALDGSFRLRSFEFDMKSDVEMHITGKVEGKDLALSITTGGAKSERKVPLKELPFINLSLSPSLRGLEVGKKMRFPLIDPSSLSQDTMELEVVGKETIAVMGQMKEAYTVKGSFRGLEMAIWVDDEGGILKEESMGMTFVREKREEAMKIEGASIDFIASAAIPFNLKLPEGVSYLKVRLTGADLSGFELDGGNQKLTGDILEVRAATSRKEGGIAPFGDDFFVQSKDPGIVKISKEIIGGEKDTLKKARLIYDWVFANIEKTPTVTIPTAVEVLKSRRGDCNEHTTLYTALARAGGVPTRMATGLVYRGGYFYYHAWPEIYNGGGWFSIDPTLGQWPSDATHIRLLTGGIENQFALSKAIGKLKIEGIEYR